MLFLNDIHITQGFHAAYYRVSMIISRPRFLLSLFPLLYFFAFMFLLSQIQTPLFILRPFPFLLCFLFILTVST